MLDHRGKLRIVGPRCGDPRADLWRFMPTKSAQAQICALVVAKSPCRGGGPAMRGGLTPLIPHRIN
ncbi:hypothetical protein BG454_14205 [Roseinatronobacter bogoriensis subsp. barguzinensis]|uniref:Uncharacterized protein n=1 Tax=Roseinatronobacter bogoriensis subsp. barguzinensis TaxID=441209 RepID=A0A2K8KBL9_9RHOB|nr:hypothetical protein BG454_14205 [Rhodobaca barguzinensis]